MEGGEARRTESINFTLNTQNGVNKTNENLMEEEELQENVTELQPTSNICSLYYEYRRTGSKSVFK